MLLLVKLMVGGEMTKQQKINIALLSLSVILIVFGLMFLLTASGAVVIFKGIADISHVIVQYIIVIVTMACGIMLFSNVSSRIEKDKLRNGMVIGITAFSTILTIPLLYVFIALFPAMGGHYGPVGEFMVRAVAEDFQAIFVSTGGQIVIYILGIIMSIIFLAFPLFTGILTVKGKTIEISKKGIAIGTLPILKKRELAEETLEEVAIGTDEDING